MQGGGALVAPSTACCLLSHQGCRTAPSPCSHPHCCVCVPPCPALQTALAVEREERVAEDDEIVAAVNDYTRALQDGLRIIANN